MWNYNYSCDDNDWLEHASHKYISKKMVNGKWRYFYAGSTRRPGEENSPLSISSQQKSLVLLKGKNYKSMKDRRKVLVSNDPKMIRSQGKGITVNKKATKITTDLVKRAVNNVKKVNQEQAELQKKVDAKKKRKKK